GREGVTGLAIHPQAPSTVFAGTFGDGIFKTTSGGATWVDVTAGLSNQAGGRITIFSLVFDPQTPATLYAGSFDNGVFKTTNGGGSWSQSNTGLPADAVVPAPPLHPPRTHPPRPSSCRGPRARPVRLPAAHRPTAPPPPAGGGRAPPPQPPGRRQCRGAYVRQYRDPRLASPALRGAARRRHLEPRRDM